MTKPSSLANSDLLAGLSTGQIEKFAGIGRDRAVKAGEAIFKLGSVTDQLFLVLSGRVDLTLPLVVMGEPKDVRIQSIETGRAIAWSALVPPHRLTMGAKAATDCELAAFSRGELAALFQSDPSLGLVVMTNLAAVVGARLLETQALWVREVQRNVSQTYR